MPRMEMPESAVRFAAPGARLAAAALVIVVVSVLVFLLLHVVPGDPVEVMLGEYAAQGDRAALRARLGLDQPLPAQWWRFVHGVVTGDLGASLASGQPVVQLVARHLGMTAILAGAALLFAVGFGIPLGIAAATRRGSVWDTLSAGLAVVAMAIPNFVLGPLLMLVFAVALGWLPIAGADTPAALILPAVTLGLSLAAVLARMTRAALLDVLAEPYITAARARGLDARRVLFAHALPNAALPLVTVIGLQLGALLSGAVVTEAVFGWPGVGQLLVDSIHRRDYPVVQAAVLVISVTYVGLNTLTDLLYRVLDPRIGGNA